MGPVSPRPPLRLLLAAALLVPLMVAIAGAWLSWHQAWVSAEREVSDAADAAAEYARRVFDGLVLRLDRADDILAGLTDAEIVAREAELHAALHRAATIGPRAAGDRAPYLFVYGRDARPLVASSAFPVPQNRPYGQREYNQVLREASDDALHVSPVYVGLVSGEPFFALTRRRRGTGNGLPPGAYDGVVNASLYVESVVAALRRLASREDDDMLSLLRDDGVILARSIPVPPGTRLPADGPVATALRAGVDRTTLVAPSPLDGVTRIAAYRRVEGYPIYAGASRPRSSVLRHWLGTLSPLLAAGAPAALALFGLALLVQRGQRDLAAANETLARRAAQRGAALAASERRTAEVLASIGEPICAVDATGRVAYASARALEFWKLPSESLIGQRFDDIFPEAIGSPAWQAKRRAAESGEALHLCVRSTITGRWIEMDIYPLADGGVTFAFRDAHQRYLAERERQHVEAALRASEEWLRLAQEAGGIGAWETIPASGARRWSDGNYRLWGVPVGTPVTPELIASIVHPDDRARVEATMKAAAQPRGRLPELEFRIIRPSDGAERVLLSWGEVAGGTEGRPLRNIGVMQDVTDRRAAQAAIRAGEARLKSALKGARLGIWERHLPSSTGTWDARATEIYGGLAPERCSPDLAEWRARVHPADRATRVAAIEAAVAPGGPDAYSAEFRFRRDDGGWNWVEVHGTVVERDPLTGRGIRLAGVAQDLTERRNAEEALRDSEERLRLAQEAGGVGSWEWIIATGALRWSESCHRLHGTDPAEPPTFDLWRAGIHPEDWPRVEASLTKVLQDGGPQWEAEFRFTRANDGAQRWMVGRGRVVRDVETGQPLRMLGIALDVTDRRRAEERLVLLAREVDHRAKNALAVVQAAVRLAPKDDAGAFARAVEGRVAALARAQVVLADAGWQGAELRVLAEGALAAFLPDDPAAATATLQGPAVQLAAEATQPIALALHELATNAAKYGGLSRPGGRVTLRWEIDTVAGMLRLHWLESGGPGIDVLPERRGFGARIIEATLRDQLGGTVERAWTQGGLCCEIALPLARAVSRSAATA